MKADAAAVVALGFAVVEFKGYMTKTLTGDATHEKELVSGG